MRVQYHVIDSDQIPIGMYKRYVFFHCLQEGPPLLLKTSAPTDHPDPKKQEIRLSHVFSHRFELQMAPFVSL